MSTLQPILWGLAAGFTMSLMLGTVFFSLLQTSIKQGFRYGMAMAAGVIVCDMLFLILALGFSDAVAEFYTTHQEMLAWVGCLAFVVLGVVQISRKPSIAQVESANKQYTYLNRVMRGFLLNLVNPGNLVIWIVALNNPLTVGLPLNQKIHFSMAGLVAIFLTESGISIAAQQFRRWATPKRLHQLDLVVGAVFIIAALQIAWKQLF